MSDTAVRRPDTGRRRSRLAGWGYALRTTNPPPGPIDSVTRWLVVTRAAVLPMTVVAGAVALLLAVRRTGFDPIDLALAYLGIVVAHTANNLMNDLFDSDVGADTDSYPRALYAPHPILSGLVTRRRLVAAIAVANAVDLAILITLGLRRGWPVVGFAVAGFVLSLAYTAPPLRLKKRGLGEPDVLVVWGPLMVGGTYYAATGTLPWQVILASVCYGLLCTAVLMGKHIDKIRYDAPAGTRTLPVILGEPVARVVTLGLMVGYYTLVIVCIAVGALPWPAVVTFGALVTFAKISPYFRRPRPDRPPERFPVWPLWFAALAFVHTRNAGALLVVGLLAAAAAGVVPAW